jgi:hypothetical protein
MLFGLFESAHTFQPGGQLYVVKIIYRSSDVTFSKQISDSPLPLHFNFHLLWLDLAFVLRLCHAEIKVQS